MSKDEKKINIGTKFKSKIECIKYFKELVSKEKFELITENTGDIPLDKVNKLIKKEEYVWINIIDELSNGEEWKYRFENNHEYWIINDTCHNAMDILKMDERYVFLFIKVNKEYEFLGLYQYMKFDIENFTKIWKRCDASLFILNATYLKDIIEKNNYDSVRKYINDREKLKQILLENGERYEFLPANMKEDEELCLISMENAFEEPLKYVGKKLLNNKGFAKKAVEKSGYALQHFSKDIRTNPEICKIASSVGFKYIDKSVYKSKDMIVEILGLDNIYLDIRNIDKQIRKDRDIIQAYWKGVKDDIDSRWWPLVSIISIDDFGNEIIDKFLKVEKQSHSTERIEQFEEQTELIQFVKIKKYQSEENPLITIIDFDKELFDESLDPVIVLIGEKENSISEEIRNIYQENEDFEENCCMIEIYRQDCDTNNYKLITKDTNKMLDLVRTIAYSTSGDEILPQNAGLDDIKCLLLDGNKEYNNIEIFKCKGNLTDIKKKIKEIPQDFANKIFMIQLVCNKNVDAYTCTSTCNMIFEEINNGNMEYYATHICDTEDIEIIIWKNG